MQKTAREKTSYSRNGRFSEVAKKFVVICGNFTSLFCRRRLGLVHKCVPHVQPAPYSSLCRPIKFLICGVVVTVPVFYAKAPTKKALINDTLMFLRYVAHAYACVASENQALALTSRDSENPHNSDDCWVNRQWSVHFFQNNANNRKQNDDEV